ncbi:MAG: PcfJ domain-containing protein [Myxococcota bacterium]
MKAVVFERYAKGCCDRAISRVFAELARDPRSLARFSAILRLAQADSGLLRRPTLQGSRVLEVEALRNLATFDGDYLRAPRDWSPESGAGLSAIASLAEHLLARYAMPHFLSSVWFGDQSRGARDKRGWFAAHGQGTRFRELRLPLTMTRRMEGIFLRSPDHLDVNRALRRAELVSLEVRPELCEAVLATRLGRHLENGPFWLTFIEFVARFQDELAANDIAPMVDFLQFVRHEPVEVWASGVLLRQPPQPAFSLSGRTPASMLRLVDNWHAALGRSRRANLSWPRSGYRPMSFQTTPVDPNKSPTRWQIVEITNSEELRLEGAALRHCVRTYAYDCRRRLSSIWSLRKRTQSNRLRPVLTIEVDPRAHEVVQARGYRNHFPTARAREMMLSWARRENLRVCV